MSRDTDSVERLRGAFVQAEGPPPAGESCLDAAELWDAVTGRVAPDTRRGMIDHTTRCARCAELWRLALHVDSDETRRPAAVVRRAASWPRWAAAAAAVVILGVGVWTLVPRLGDPGVTLRTVPGTDLRGSIEDGATLSRDDFVLRWTGGPPSAVYQVRLRTEDLQPVFTREGVVETMLRIPADALAQLPEGTRLIWQVEAIAPDGARELSGGYVVVLE